MTVYYPDLAQLILRAFLGIMMAAHGWPKLKNFKGTAQWLASIGHKPGSFWAGVLIVSELIGGIALIVGFATRVFALLLVGEFLNIMRLKLFVWKRKFAMGEGEWDYDFLILGISIALLLLGAGAYSADGLIGWMLG